MDGMEDKSGNAGEFLDLVRPDFLLTYECILKPAVADGLAGTARSVPRSRSLPRNGGAQEGWLLEMFSTDRSSGALSPNSSEQDS
jgi:hypothetical protein